MSAADDTHPAFGDLLRVHTSVIDGIVVLSVAGELDVSTAPKLDRAITRCITGPLAGLIVDLANVNFMASAGISILLEGDSTARTVSKWFGVVANSRVMQRPMELLGLNQIMNIYSTLDAARSDVATWT